MVMPVKKPVLLRYPKIPIIIITIKGLPIKTKSEKTIIGKSNPEKSENISEEPRMTKNIKIKKSRSERILAAI